MCCNMIILFSKLRIEVMTMQKNNDWLDYILYIVEKVRIFATDRYKYEPQSTTTT